MKPEGWYTDPYARHEARWLSDGVPTKLVRDGDVTSYDEAPDGPFVREPEPIEPDPGRGNADDLRRADDAEGGPVDLDHDETWMRSMDAVWSDGAPMDLMWPEDAPPKHGRHKHDRRKDGEPG
jgi:hypothetical protein